MTARTVITALAGDFTTGWWRVACRCGWSMDSDTWGDAWHLERVHHGQGCPPPTCTTLPAILPGRAEAAARDTSSRPWRPWTIAPSRVARFTGRVLADAWNGAA